MINEIESIIKQFKAEKIEYFQIKKDGINLTIESYGQKVCVNNNPIVFATNPPITEFTSGFVQTQPLPATNPVERQPLYKELSKQEISKLLSAEEDNLTPEQILYMATPYYDELTAKEEEHKERLRAEGRLRPEGQ